MPAKNKCLWSDRGCPNGHFRRKLCQDHYVVEYPDVARCSFEGCERPRWSKGLCSTHTVQAKSGKPLKPIRNNHNKVAQHGSIGMYSNHGCRCGDCTTAYNAHKYIWRKSRKPEDLDAPHGSMSKYNGGCRCPVCSKAKGQYSWEHRAVTKLRREMEQIVGERFDCDCCGKEQTKKLVTDHIHGSLHIRGLLCNTCNTGLGKLGDNIAGLEKALAYLRRTTPENLV